MSEELRQLREATEVRCALLDNEKWASRPDVFELPYEAELPNNNSIYIDKNIRGEGRGIYRELQELKGMMIHTQSKLNEHIDKSKARLKDRF